MLYILILLFGHWFADFFMQDDNTSKNKSKNNYVLLNHSLEYSTLMTLFTLIIFINSMIFDDFLLVFLMFFISHFFIDYVTSRINSFLWSKKEVHLFFTSIGFDQFLHYIIILLVLRIMGSL